MSGNFMAVLIAVGNEKSQLRFAKKVEQEWYENIHTSTIMVGFNYVQKAPPKKEQRVLPNGDMEVTYEFWGDGSNPEQWPVLMSHQHPGLKFSFIVADPHPSDPLAAIVAAYKGVYVAVRYARNNQQIFGRYLSTSHERLILALKKRLVLAHQRIDENGNLHSLHKIKMGAWYETGDAKTVHGPIPDGI